MQNGNKGPRQKTVAASSDREDIRRVRQEGFRAGGRESSNRDFQRVAENDEQGSAPFGAENQGLGTVKGSAPSKTEEIPTSSVSIRRAGYVGAPATPGVMAHRCKETK
jgi:hypothetical protein